MGAESSKLPVRADGNNQGGVNTQRTPAPAPAAQPQRPDRNSAAAGAGTRTPAPARTADGTAGAGKTQEEKKPAGLAVLTEAPPVPEAPKKQQRKKRTPKKKDEPTSFNAQQITALIVSISSIFASREGLEMFALSELEAQQIATPLANIIAKNEKLSGVSEHADAIALVTACFVVMVPRLKLYFDAQKQKKIKAAGGVRLVDNRKDEKRESAGNSGKPAGASTPQPAVDDFRLSSAIPSLI